MPKRHGDLFDQCFTVDALFEGYERASKGKKKSTSVQAFGDHLGAEIVQLHSEIHEGTYRPRGFRRFYVYEPKLREISAPHFRDTIVQHAIYNVIYPIFDRTFIHQNYGCRVGKGTHDASNQVQSYLRQCESDDYILQLDIRRFYYRINRKILRKLIEKKIKDKRLVDLIMLFADSENDLGVPIGSLLSQLLALIYLNSMDHYIKRNLKVSKYVRYVDDFVMFGLTREQAEHIKHDIEHWLWDNLELELSKWSIHKVKRGVNFVGFRTWRKTRFLRKHSIHSFTKSMKKGHVNSMISILGNAKQTASFNYLVDNILETRPDLVFQLPRSICQHYSGTNQQ